MILGRGGLARQINMPFIDTNDNNYLERNRTKICNIFKDEKDDSEDSKIVVELYKPNMKQTEEHKSNS